jgi:hypothetical protein
MVSIVTSLHFARDDIGIVTCFFDADIAGIGIAGTPPGHLADAIETGIKFTISESIGRSHESGNRYGNERLGTFFHLLTPLGKKVVEALGGIRTYGRGQSFPRLIVKPG